MAEPLNIQFVMTEQQRADCGRRLVIPCCRSEMDRIGREGVSFTSALCPRQCVDHRAPAAALAAASTLMVYGSIRFHRIAGEGGPLVIL